MKCFGGDTLTACSTLFFLNFCSLILVFIGRSLQEFLLFSSGGFLFSFIPSILIGILPN